MKLCYPYHTESSLTTQGQCGDFEQTLNFCRPGFDGVELMVRNPRELSAHSLKAALGAHHLSAAVLGTMPMTSQDKLGLANKDAEVRKETYRRMKEAIDLSGELGVAFCIGQVRGRISDDPGNSREEARKSWRSFAVRG
jgi:sugar phosphate isomerase/epimerase